VKKFISKPKTKPRMKSLRHFLLSLILALIFYPIFNWKVLFIFVGGVLIDIDHYLWYLYKYKKFNVFHAYKFYIDKINEKREHENIGILLILHTIEFLLLIGILSFYSETILLIAIGLVFHYILDLTYIHSVLGRLIANPSIILWIIKNKNQRKQGFLGFKNL